MLDLNKGDIVRFLRDDFQGGGGVRAGEHGIIVGNSTYAYRVMVGNPDTKNVRLVQYSDGESWLEYVRSETSNPHEYWSAHWHDFEPETKVIFRFWRDGDFSEVLALFPELPDDTRNWYTCEAYSSDDQWVGADPLGIIHRSRPATPEEYAPIKRELESAPNFMRLKVYQRQSWKMRAAREREWRQAMGKE